MTFGLKARLGGAAVCVFVEPVASAGMLAALALGGGRAMPVYDVGLSNEHGRRWPDRATASQLVLDQVGHLIDAVVASLDATMLDWTRRAWREGGLRLEPSAAAALAAISPLLSCRPMPSEATHLAWATVARCFPIGSLTAWCRQTDDRPTRRNPCRAER